MALADNRLQRTLTLCALYVAQGVPWGFMLITLPAYLAHKYNVGDDEIGQLTAIILVPWSFKLLWAPIMDTFTIRSMGRRRPWIIGSELLMAVTLLGFWGLGDLSEKMQLLLFMYFLHNCFASLQDVCTDALAVDILPPHEQGQMNGLMWGSKLVGKGVGAWGLSIVLSHGGLEACVVVQITILLAIMLIPMLILECNGEKRFPWSKGSEAKVAAANVRNPAEVFKAFVRGFSLTTTIVYIVFTLVKLIGVGINEVVTKTLYIQQLNPKWTDVNYSTAAGLYAIAPIIIAAILGGLLGDRFGRRKVLLVGFGGYGLAAFIFAANPGMWNERWFAMSYLLSFETLNAVASVGFLSMAMRISWTSSAAIVFTTYMTLSNVSHVTGNWLAGPVRRMFLYPEYGESATLVSYELTFWFVGLLSIAPLLLLIVVSPEEVDRARDAERRSDD
ncbi:MAG: MFS transporter [Planctomycetes bacterium]|nr:MFS transporter [Planctomycetota bacterium]